MKRTSLDTNVLLRWLLQDIEDQAAAAEKLINSKADFDIADMAISELVYVLETLVGADRQTIANNIYRIVAQHNFNCNRELLMKVTKLYLRYPAQSFVDCCLVAYAELNGATPLFTFDKKLGKQLEQAKLLK